MPAFPLMLAKPSVQHIGVDVVGLGNRRNGGSRLVTSVDDLRLELRAVSSALSPGLDVNTSLLAIVSTISIADTIAVY